MMKRCNNCFKTFNSELGICPYCGYEDEDPAKEPYFLHPGMTLNNRYIVGEVLGFGGFGITYKAWDSSLNTVVAVKEYYYSGLATREPSTQMVKIYAQNRRAEFQHFLNRFLDEARYTAKFSKNNNIVNVYEFFEANNTAYMVMEFLDGVTLSERLKKSEMDCAQSVSIIQCVCSALRTVHADGVIHRDISPDNIMLCSNGKVKLFDFGAARFSRNEEQQTIKLTQVMKPGFSTPEQYQTVSKQGPWTDIYALGATLYYMTTGRKPVESTNRKTEESLIPPKDIKLGTPEHINDTILRAMAVDMHLRFASVDEFEKALCKEKKVLNVAKERRRRRKNRVIGLNLAILAVVFGFLFFFYFYEQQRREVELDGEIEFWFSVPEDDAALGEAKMRSFEAIIADFIQGYPDVAIKLMPLPESEYIDAINAAYRENALPPLFESAGVDETVLRVALSVDAAVRAVDSSDVFFFNDFSAVFPDFRQFPLGFIMPVRFTNDSAQDTGSRAGSDRETFLGGMASELVGSTADYFDVQRALAGRYSVGRIMDGEVICTFTDLLSIGDCSASQLAIVNRFLVFLLSERAQDYLHIQYQSSSLPLNRDALLVGYVFVYDELSGFFDNVDSYRIKNPNDHGG